jgi:cobalt-zinc-cadmium efflux system outer membrane protein
MRRLERRALIDFQVIRPTWKPVRAGAISIALLLCAAAASAQPKTYTWEELREKFRATNPTLKAAQVGIDQSRAQEITAYLRPNPEITGTFDQMNFFTTQPSPDGNGGNSYSPFAFALPSTSMSYLHERGGKRELRRDSARQGTAIAESTLADQERNLLFNLRGAFVQALQAQAVLGVTRENLAYFDRVLSVSRERFKAGDIARLDLDRLELQRVQYVSDVQTAQVNLRTAKIQLLALMNDRTPVEQFDVTGTFDFKEEVILQDELRKNALENRPDLRAAVQSIQKSEIDHKLAIANGTTDPTFSVDLARNPPIPAYLGLSVTIPLRIFDKNQGEKLRTELDVKRNQHLRDAAEAQIYSDVDSAYATLTNTVTLLRPYKTDYLKRAAQVRETVSFAYERGGVSLLDFLQAQQDYRSVQLSYLNLIGSYLTAASQLNLAVGREVIQ